MNRAACDETSCLPFFWAESHYSGLVTRSSNLMHVRSHDHGRSAHYDTYYASLYIFIDSGYDQPYRLPNKWGDRSTP